MGRNNDFGNRLVDDEEEALSLRDLPIIQDNQSSKEKEEASPTSKIKNDDHFDFCSMLMESEMRSADELFFEGQILPLRHSVTSESSLTTSMADLRNSSAVWRSSSVSILMEDHNYSSGSSSIRSHQSSSSGNVSSKSTPIYKPSIHNQNQDRFHSHPSPKPQIKFSNYKKQNEKSTMWTYFRLSLLTTPEIALQDLKVRSNSNNSNGSSSNNSLRKNTHSPRLIRLSDKKKKHNPFDKNGILFGGCMCSEKAVETMEPSRVVTIKRSASLNEEYLHAEAEAKDGDRLAIKATRKQALSRHRTFEWLKQLSLESVISAADDD